ncbi:heat shock 70 kDa protein 13 [Aplysia californica]|uniref:Heat shock 70 kDa protein 13 n=1 Tax=Aplysia californica TaxID=6500 RepID=A0ABM0JNW0_APLCA|nr:heat shock 70 kDa protein 13 [Aplysia californica]
MSSSFIIIGTSILALLLAGYFAQKYLPPPPPKVVGIDLGTTYSCIGMYHAVSGNVTILETQDGHKCIPSVVAFTEDGVLVGYKAVAQAEHNPFNTLYDAKRFIGKKFTDEELKEAQKQYAFKLQADPLGMVTFLIEVNGTQNAVAPEEVGYYIISELARAAERNLSARVKRVVMSVPAEFDDMQRNYTIKSGSLADLDVLRLINEPTAAAMAYGLHKKTSPHNILVVDLGGGTLDVSLLNVQGGMFLTQAMAGNNHLGGQDFNQRLMNHLLGVISSRYGLSLKDKEDIQGLRLKVEEAKLNLTSQQEVLISLTLHSLDNVVFSEKISRTQFEKLNADLFEKVLIPINRVLESTELLPEDVDEIVLVGGSTRIPKVIEMVSEHMGKRPNTHIDPELAVVTGVSVQAGILGGMWPLTVSAVELPSRVKKMRVH